ncbi:gamma carbonic anhydrase family protein [Stagnihabitans tardus]|uniref:Gamma carbonic anhydrase family protein n=1 Tax=Stagnihabitans tardus TaxID=2699202 RepID=A0AAE5BWE0_9RHOB|nr:gamma carbonic anhydrase family protein [Stagnihabitans tardus]NBZ89916.1 gamma carbonic anhydrase family protein [Stagnihabitans tardus]
MSPWISPLAQVASDCTIIRPVTIGPGCRIQPGARIVAEGGGRIRLGAACIVLEKTSRQDCTIGDHCLIGPHAHVVGAEIADEVFIATGASIFHGARIGKGAEVRIKATVHLRTTLEAGAVVPIGWVAVGTPAQILSPDQHAAIWEVQSHLDFPGFVYGIDRTEPDLMRKICARLSEELGPH